MVSGLAGTGIGGLSAFLLSRSVSKRCLSFLLEFSAGLMTSVVCFELIPEAFRLGGTVCTISSVAAGTAAVVASEVFIERTDVLGSSSHSVGLLKTGVMMAWAIALHNFPEGIAVGSGFNASISLGVTITAAIVIHDIPEGIAMAIPLRAAGLSRGRTFLYTLLSGLPMGFGAILGMAAGSISDSLISICLGFAAGAMLYIVFGELVFESKKMYPGRLSSLGNVIGIICGIIISVSN